MLRSTAKRRTNQNERITVFFNHVRTELGIAVEELKAAETYEDAEESKMFVLGMIHAFSTLADSMFIGKDTTQYDFNCD